MTPKQEAKLKLLLTSAHFDHQKGLTARALFKINDSVVSGDLVQDTFIKTWSYLVKGGKINMMKAFLYHILNKLIIDEYRKKKIDSLDLLSEKGFELGIDNSKRLFNFIDGKKAIQLIANLPVKYQKVMRMKYVQDLSISEISILTKQSKNAVTVQTYRGLEKLKVLYNQNK